MMHQDSLEPAAIRFALERLQESARRSDSSHPVDSSATFKSTGILVN